MSEGIDFYFDFASPYGYFAGTRIDDLAARHGRTVTWSPILLGAVMKITGMVSFATAPMRSDYFYRDIGRFARYLGVPFTQPATIPMHSLAASRAYYWALENRPEMARSLAKAIFHAHWGEGRDLSEPDAVADVAADLGIERASLVDGIRNETVKQALRQATDTAVARGVFGSPYIFVDGEPFWGTDRLDQVDRWLASGGW